MSRALPPNWRQIGFALHGSGTSQILLIACGLAVLLAGLFLFHAILPGPPGAAVSSMSRSRRLMFALVTCGLMVLMTAGGTEAVLRAIGQTPYIPPQSLDSTGYGGGAFRSDPVLGYTHAPGASTYALRNGHSFVAHHLENTLRVTRPLNSPKNERMLPEVWVFGCSLTYGWSVADDKTFTWLLDQMHPGLKVVNFGVTGYGTVQSLCQLREVLRDGVKPAVVVLAYASLHDERNTFQRSWRKVAGRFARPYARFDRGNAVRFAFGRPGYTEWPGMRRSALIHAAERYYNQREAVRLRSHDVSKEVVGAFARTCDEVDVPWILAGMDQAPLTTEMVAFAASQGWQALDMGVDLRHPANNNAPIDAHPSAVAHAAYARKLHEFIVEGGFVGKANRDKRHVRRPSHGRDQATNMTSNVGNGS